MRRNGYRLSAAGLTATVAMALAATTAAARPAPHETGSATADTQLVCGTLTPDAKYRSDARKLGTEHACEHLEGRAYTESAAATRHDAAERRTLISALASTGRG